LARRTAYSVAPKSDFVELFGHNGKDVTGSRRGQMLDEIADWEAASVILCDGHGSD
jgi:hypothetical protein